MKKNSKSNLLEIKGLIVVVWHVTSMGELMSNMSIHYVTQGYTIWLMVGKCEDIVYDLRHF